MHLSQPGAEHLVNPWRLLFHRVMGASLLTASRYLFSPAFLRRICLSFCSASLGPPTSHHHRFFSISTIHFFTPRPQWQTETRRTARAWWLQRNTNSSLQPLATVASRGLAPFLRLLLAAEMATSASFCICFQMLLPPLSSRDLLAVAPS
jgi:hypothetical protein